LNTPILVLVHQGSENWAKTLPISRHLDPLLQKLPKKSYDRIKETRLLSIPFLVRRPKELKVMYKLYQPGISADDLNTDLETQKILLKKESDNVRTLMQSMIDQLKST
jgi:hypothetical protein